MRNSWTNSLVVSYALLPSKICTKIQTYNTVEINIQNANQINL